MPVRDRYRDAVRDALIKDGWAITHDPFQELLGRLLKDGLIQIIEFDSVAEEIIQWIS